MPRNGWVTLARNGWVTMPRNGWVSLVRNMQSAKTEYNKTKTNVRDELHGAELGVTVGMSYVKPSLGLGFDIRYNQGLTNILAWGPYNSFNSGIQLGIFYVFTHQSSK